jgi:pimeloyl-ACP methyl ester carboxylesterase
VLAVPVDPRNPNGASLNLRIARLPSIGPGRAGTLLFIPGGPGVSIEGTLGGAERQIAEFRRHFDVVTFDPRGVGESEPIRCDPRAVPRPPAPSLKAPTREQFRGIMARNAALFQSCFQLSSSLMPHLSSIETAADIEQIRRTLTPTEGLVAYAGSYGTLYATMYLERYGSHVKALVLDGIVDHSIDQPTDVTRSILATNDTFGRMSKWCARTVSCPLHGKNVGAVFDNVVQKVPLTKTLVPQMLAAGQLPGIGWPAITKMLAEVSRGDMTTLNALTKASSEARGNGPSDPQIVAGMGGLYAGVVCADYGATNDYNRLIAAGRGIVRQAPRFAWKFWDWTPVAHSAAGALDCTGWSRQATNLPHVLHVGYHRNVLIANPAHDPSTALPNALAVHQQIPGSLLLVLPDADGHQALVRSQCAYGVMERFLTDPESVDSKVACRD